MAVVASLVLMLMHMQLYLHATVHATSMLLYMLPKMLLYMLPTCYCTCHLHALYCHREDDERTSLMRTINMVHQTDGSVAVGSTSYGSINSSVPEDENCADKEDNVR